MHYMAVLCFQASLPISRDKGCGCGGPHHQVSSSVTLRRSYFLMEFLLLNLELNVWLGGWLWAISAQPPQCS